jgi:hypothetical protein
MQRPEILLRAGHMDGPEMFLKIDLRRLQTFTVDLKRASSGAGDQMSFRSFRKATRIAFLVKIEKKSARREFLESLASLHQMRHFQLGSGSGRWPRIMTPRLHRCGRGDESNSHRTGRESSA